ncbi:hypothetical protein U1Q18_003626 [Sarracenia purpurea var. burkii]
MDSAAGHGKRSGDALRAGVRRRPPGDARNLHATLVDNPLRHLLPHLTPLPLRHADPKTPRPATRHRRPRRKILRPSHPPDVLSRRHFSHPEVPASPKQGGDHGVDRIRRPFGPHRVALPLHPHFGVGHRRRRGSVRRDGLGGGGGAGGVHRGVVQGRVEGVVLVGFEGALAVRETVGGVGDHDLSGDLVLHEHNYSHRTPCESGHRRRITLHLHEHQWLGRHVVHWN